jgi:putative MATE family efflux protein
MPTPARAALVTGDVRQALRSLAVPSAVGMLAMIAVGLVDAYWISRLGTAELAALSFTFPIESLTVNVGLGLMVGMSTAVSRAAGAGDMQRASRLVTHAIGLAVVLLIGVAAVGWTFHAPLFRALGADDATLPHISAYMRVWFVGVIFLMVPMLANGALRAVGDAKTPMRVMLLGAALNAVFDPLFIFGAGPIPGFGLPGAAMASLASRLVGMSLVMWALAVKAGLVDRARPRLAEVVDSVRTVLRVGVPAVVTNALGPLAVTLVTGMVATQGPAALAAWGTGARVDALAMIAPVALSGALSPFVGQNWGAHLRKRVAEGIRSAVVFSLIWGVGVAALLMVAARPVAALFADDPAVKDALVVYLRTIPVGYAFLACVGLASSVFNAVDHALRSTWLSALRSLLLAVPAAYVGAQAGGLRGLCLGLVVASVSAAVLGVHWMRALLHPSGELTSELGRRLTLEAAVEAVAPALRDRVRAALGAVAGLEDLQFAQVRGGLVGVYVGARELAHLHPDGRLDAPLPVEIGDNLVARGLCVPHPEHPDDGWYTHDLAAAEGPQGAEWLLRFTHALYEMSQRGPGDPVTRAELDTFTVTDQCVAAMTAAATRWGLRMEQPSRAVQPA